MGIPSGFELVVVVAVVLLLFGGKKIPELAKGLGQGIKNFKSAIKDDKEESADKDKIENSKTETTSSSTTNETKKA